MADSTSTITTEPSAWMEIDHAVLTLSDGETYITRLSKPYGAVLTEAETTTINSGSAINLDYALSGRTFTIRYEVAGTGVTDKKVSIQVYGRK